MIRENTIHFRATVSLPSLSSREAERAKLERDVEAFLTNGGKIKKVGNGVSGPMMPFCINPGRNAGIATLRPATKSRDIVWTGEMLKALRQQYHKMDKQDLADLLGVTAQHLYNKAAFLGLTSRRNQKDGE